MFSGWLADGKEQMTLLDVENTKITNRCEVLHQLNLSLEEDRKSLMSQVSLLLSQYHDLLTQTLDDKEHYHEEEREYSERMNNLRRQKEKLEEKIMEQYKKMENSTPKKKGIGFSLVKKMRKAGSSMFLSSPSGRSRSRGADQDHDSSSLGSGGNDSIDSGGGHSPADTMMDTDKMMFRRGMALPGLGHDTDSEPGNIADNDSLASFLSSVHGGGGLASHDMDMTSHDLIPTRDTGPGLMRDNRDDYDTASYMSSTTLTTPQNTRKTSEKQPR